MKNKNKGRSRFVVFKVFFYELNGLCQGDTVKSPPKELSHCGKGRAGIRWARCQNDTLENIPAMLRKSCQRAEPNVCALFTTRLSTSNRRNKIYIQS